MHYRVQQIPLVAAVVNAIAQAKAILLLIEKGIDQFDVLHQVSALVANNLVHVVETEMLLYRSHSSRSTTIYSFRQKERHILVARGILAQGLEHGHLLSDLHAVHAILELVQEAFVGQPKQSDVRNLEQIHRETLEANSHRPATILL